MFSGATPAPTRSSPLSKTSPTMHIQIDHIIFDSIKSSNPFTSPLTFRRSCASTMDDPWFQECNQQKGSASNYGVETLMGLKYSKEESTSFRFQDVKWGNSSAILSAQILRKPVNFDAAFIVKYRRTQLSLKHTWTLKSFNQYERELETSRILQW